MTGCCGTSISTKSTVPLWWWKFMISTSEFVIVFCSFCLVLRFVPPFQWLTMWHYDHFSCLTETCWNTLELCYFVPLWRDSIFPKLILTDSPICFHCDFLCLFPTLCVSPSPSPYEYEYDSIFLAVPFLTVYVCRVNPPHIGPRSMSRVSYAKGLIVWIAWPPVTAWTPIGCNPHPDGYQTHLSKTL